MYIVYANIVWAHRKVHTIYTFALHRPIIILYTSVGGVAAVID